MYCTLRDDGSCPVTADNLLCNHLLSLSIVKWRSGDENTHTLLVSCESFGADLLKSLEDCSIQNTVVEVAVVLMSTVKQLLEVQLAVDLS